MNAQLLASMFLGLVSTALPAIEVITPQELQTSVIRIGDPDRHIKTLGKVAFQIDLAASHDNLLALKVRRSDLKLKDGREFTAFGVHKNERIIILAGGDVTHVSIASVENKIRTKDAQILFYGKDNEIISPKAKDIAVFNTNFEALDFTYTPQQTPGSLEIPLTIALDTSGSMYAHMSTVVPATRDFMRALPDFTRCQLLSFNNDVRHLTPRGSKGQANCPSSAYILNSPLQAGGATALYKAIETGFTLAPFSKKSDFPNIVVVVTDGVNTVNFAGSSSSLKKAKKTSNSKLFVFWAGNYEKDHLQGLADKELVSTQNLDQELTSFFSSLGVSLSGLQTLKIEK
ncbi:MAG: VWA domain-containing protein [gamma proteobacterium endosymbiont of Lamellibrachia anaximandri]|nr:VWA domain-containing protein [gamma proteobacterium endosymbiont of Lamellibrachia anaximandri]MBL3619463.1 VWA domain-containing protein [gamma proteobacterium endosymbiont of Lamellibrachia anaximandri]